MAVRIRARDTEHCVGTWENLLIAVWGTETRATAIAEFGRVLDELVGHHGEIGLVQVVEPGASSPDTDARRALGALLRRQSESIRCSAIVFEGDGFRAATVRAVVTGIALVSRPPYPHVVFSTAAAALTWTGHRLARSGAIWAEQARQVVTDLRQTIVDARAG